MLDTITLSENLNDEKVNFLIFVGANTMNEIENYNFYKYSKGIFIEAIPQNYVRFTVPTHGLYNGCVFSELSNNLNNYNKKYQTHFTPINALITNNKDGDLVTFNLFDNAGSSSLYDTNPEEWTFDGIKKFQSFDVPSTRMSTLLNKFNTDEIGTSNWDVILDVQGAELEVLKSFDDNYFKNIKNLRIEISQKEIYKGGVLFDELNKFLVDNNFELQNKEIPEHGDIHYKFKETKL